MPSQLQVWRQQGYKQVQQLKLCAYVTAKVPASLFWETENTIPTQGSCLPRIDSFQKKKQKKKNRDAASNASTKKRHDSSHKSGGESETKTSATIIIGANPQSNTSTTEEESVEDAFQDSENSSGGEHRLFISQQAGSHGHINQSVQHQNPTVCGPWTLGNQDFCYAELCVCPICYQRWFTAWDALFLRIFHIEVQE